jgi:hypothetical protein
MGILQLLACTTWEHLQASNQSDQLFHPKLAEGIITCYCGALKGTIHGGLQNLLSPTR